MLIIFDLDGTLVNTKEDHFLTLNAALKDSGYPPISFHDHLIHYDGLPTIIKLHKLGIPLESQERIRRKKQQLTLDIFNKLPYNQNLVDLCGELTNRGHTLAIASNAVMETIRIALRRLGIIHFFKYVASAEILEPKPDPAMYWNIMQRLNFSASQTLIIEDGQYGRKAAEASGAKFLIVDGPNDLTLDKILGNSPLWSQPNLNIVVPMAGEGSRFAAAGYTFPKPLIEIHGKPMIQHVVESLGIEAKFHFVAKAEHIEKYSLQSVLDRICCRFDRLFWVWEPTKGAAQSVLRAAEYIDNDDPLLIVNSDQIIEWDVHETMESFSSPDIDGGILVFNSTHPKWSYVRTGETGLAEYIAEKQVISDLATVGIYYWKHGRDFVRHAYDMINRNERVNNEFYVAPVFNHAISEGARILVKPVRKMIGLGDPESLERYLNGQAG